MTGPLLLAHASAGGGGGGGGGGTNLLAALAGLAVVMAGLALRSRDRGPAALGWAAVVVGGALVLFTFVTPRPERPEITLTLASPDGGQVVAANRPVPVTATVLGGKVATSPTGDGGHLHLSVDGALEQMPYRTTTQVTLTPGTHTLRLEYVDEKHVSYKPPIAVEVRVLAR